MYSLEPTAALVMIWAKPLYESGMASRLVGSLDMSGGEELCRLSEELCPWYGEVIRDRKYFLPLLAGHYIKKAGRCQVILPAAGMSPIALELIEDYGDHIAKAFEMDVAGMEDKQRLYEELFPGLRPGIEFLSADIRDKRMRGMLAKRGYDASVPSVIVLEGISYYLSRQELLDMAGMYRSPGHDNVIIIEYLMPCDEVTEERRYIPRNEFNAIKQYCHLSHIQTYTRDTLAETLGLHGGTVESHHTMRDMEQVRLGRLEYFKSPGDWWIECLAARV